VRPPLARSSPLLLLMPTALTFSASAAAELASTLPHWLSRRPVPASITTRGAPTVPPAVRTPCPVTLICWPAVTTLLSSRISPCAPRLAVVAAVTLPERMLIVPPCTPTAALLEMSAAFAVNWPALVSCTFPSAATLLRFRAMLWPATLALLLATTAVSVRSTAPVPSKLTLPPAWMLLDVARRAFACTRMS